MTQLMQRHHSARRYAEGKNSALNGATHNAEARIEILDNIDDLKEMNAKLCESLAKNMSNGQQADEKLWADVDGDKEDHHLGAGLNGRWF